MSVEQCFTDKNDITNYVYDFVIFDNSIAIDHFEERIYDNVSSGAKQNAQLGSTD